MLLDFHFLKQFAFQFFKIKVLLTGYNLFIYFFFYNYVFFSIKLIFKLIEIIMKLIIIFKYFQINDEINFLESTIILICKIKLL